MNEDYKKWEANCKRIRQQNEGLLKAFGEYLTKAGLSKKTITSHIQNVDFFINDYLLSQDELYEAKEGALEISWFLGDWFIRKAAWASKAHIKSNVASLKKFYTFLVEKGDMDQANFKEFKELIKEELPDWLANMENYDDGSYFDNFW